MLPKILVGILVLLGLKSQAVEAPIIKYPETQDIIVVQGNSALYYNTPFFAPYLPVLEEFRTLGYIDDPPIVEKAEKIILCESGGKHEVWGKAGEFGIAQFKKETFYWMAKQAKLENPDWKDKDQQVYLLLWALKNNLGKNWTCNNK